MTTPTAGSPPTGLPPVEVRRPQHRSAPLIFASPHSGRAYPHDFVQLSRLSPLALRRSEDAFVDQLFAAAPDLGAPLILAHFPRAYVDANREAFELDPAMFSDKLPGHVTTRSPRIAAGLGTVPKVVANGEAIYSSALRFDEVRERIAQTHTPYHEALAAEVAATRDAFGLAIVVDCHSMPSQPLGQDRGERGYADIVLGDCHGTSCSDALSDLAERTFRELGFSVARNRPYAGGYTTRHYGRPREGVHALQIEINRALYLDEETIRPLPQMNDMTRRMTAFIEALLDAEGFIQGIPNAAQ